MKARRIPTVVIAVLALVLAGSAPAFASEAIDTFSVSSSTSQAGGHPDLRMSFTLDSPGSPESAKDVIVNTPEGVFGNPNAISRCTSSDFALHQCAPGAQAGLVTVYANHGGEPGALLGTAPIYDLQPGADQAALFAFVVPTLDIPINVPVAVRTGSDFGLRFTVSGLTQLAPLAASDLTFWGFPADESHDAQRFPKGSFENPPECPQLADASCLTKETQAAISVHPLIDNPSVCTGQPLTVTLDVTTYQDPTHPTHKTAGYPETTGCYNMTFKPVLQGTTTTSAADAPSGLDLTLNAPQSLGEATTPSPIHAAILSLPEGLTINPDAADGQSACSDSGANFGSEAPGSCPDQSKIGTFAIKSPAFDGPLEGAIYIGDPRPRDQYRIFLIADGFGIHAKFVGSFEPNPATGRLTARIEGLPQVPFESFQLHLFASDRGLMATPTACTLYPISARFFPWNTALPDVTSTQFFSITVGANGTGCPGQVRPFHPRLVAGTSNPSAGAFSDFHLKLDRDDGDQFLRDVNFKMPPGFTGSLRGISYCPETSIAAAANRLGREEQQSPSCPESSLVGTTNVAAGPGSHPFHAVGRMYLAGPLNGASLSLVAITPALAGPYDYGVVVVRVALHVDPLTAQVSAVSEPMPQIIGGVPIRMRSIQVNIDREHFTINPTNCNPLSVDSKGIGDQGTVTDFSSYFHAANCSTLPFRPKMTVTQLGKRKDTKRNRNPVLRFDLYTRKGDANIKSVAVTLPKAFAVDQRHLGNICSKAELAAKHCAGRQPIGTVETTTPLLDQPLQGPAYAVSGFGVLPHIVFILGGQVTLLPEAESTSVKGKLKTTVPVVPDAPIGHFRLSLFGGKQGYLINTGSLCQVQTKTLVEYTAQNGKTLTQSVVPKTACPKGKRAARRG